MSGVVDVTYQPTDPNLPPAKKRVPFIIGAPNAKQSAIEGSTVSTTVAPTRRRTYWNVENIR